MSVRKKILAIVGSASEKSANLSLVESIKQDTRDVLDISIFTGLKALPHFDPQLSADNPPEVIIAFRKSIEEAAGVLICTPEYIFSIPSGLKNAIEWCIATTVFMNKPLGIITASAQGEKGHEELQLIMRTAMARFTKESTLLIQGIKGKIDRQGNISDVDTREKLNSFIAAFKDLLTDEQALQ